MKTMLMEIKMNKMMMKIKMSEDSYLRVIIRDLCYEQDKGKERL